MSTYQTTWGEIYRSLVEDKNSEMSYNKGIVNYDNLTEHLDTLYTKIAELERRLDKEEEYRQEQNDRQP